jgi:rod shape determining protein RodA
MPIVQLLPLLFIFILGTINLLGIREDLIIRHLIFFGVGMGLFTLIRLFRVKAHFLKHNAPLFYFFFLILLILTYFVGVEVKGSRRWIELYVFQPQPSEFFKIIFIIFMANLLSSYNALKHKSSMFILSLISTVVPFLLIYKQPDLGTAMVIFAIFFVMVFHSPIPKRQIFIFLSAILIMLPIVWFSLHDYQRERIYTFIKPTEDAHDTSYNITQAIIAVGSGHILGRGLGLGKQSQLYFLPEYHTDFAFSSFVEQFGFLGGLILIVLYGTFFAFLVKRMMHYFHQKDESGKFNYYYLVGFSALFVFQTCVNIGMNMGILPIAGITLPFISYGGSSLMTFLIGLALLP